MKRYWMVHADGGGSPKMKHRSIIDADTEAMRLAKANPGTKFALLEAIEYYICELPNPKAYKTETPDNCETLAESAGMIPVMRGKHPENIVWDDEPDRPLVFIVEDVETDGTDVFITIKPEFPTGPDWTCLRKDDDLRWDCWDYRVIEAPTSSRIKISPKGKIRTGDKGTVVKLLRKE